MFCHWCRPGALERQRDQLLAAIDAHSREVEREVSKSHWSRANGALYQARFDLLRQLGRDSAATTALTERLIAKVRANCSAGRAPTRRLSEKRLSRAPRSLKVDDMDAREALWTARELVKEYGRQFTSPDAYWGDYIVPLRDGELLPPVSFDPDAEERMVKSQQMLIWGHLMTAQANGAVMVMCSDEVPLMQTAASGATEAVAAIGMAPGQALMRVALVRRFEDRPPQIVDWAPEEGVPSDLFSWIDFVCACLENIEDEPGVERHLFTVDKL